MVIGAKFRTADHSSAFAAEPRPAALDAVPEQRIVDADVRDELRAGREPFSMIMAARAAVPAHGALRVRAIFEPVPLYAVMKKHGFAHWTERRADDDWLVWFYQEPAAAASREAPAPVDGRTSPANAAASADDVIILDVRGLEPPEPMTLTLAALERLPEHATLLQLNVRVPKFLLPMLEERGFTYEIREQGDDGVVRLFIRRGTPAAS